MNASAFDHDHRTHSEDTAFGLRVAVIVTGSRGAGPSLAVSAGCGDCAPTTMEGGMDARIAAKAATQGALKDAGILNRFFGFVYGEG